MVVGTRHVLTSPIAVHPMVQTPRTRPRKRATLRNYRTVNKFRACVPSHSKLQTCSHRSNLNGFPLRSVLLLGYKYYYSKMTAHSSSTPHPQKQTSHSASFPCVCHGQREFWVERLPPGRGEHGSGSTRDVPPRCESSRHAPPCGSSSTEVPPRR